MLDAAIAYYTACYSEDPEASKKASADFVRCYREAAFLFGLNSAVYHALTAVKDTHSTRPIDAMKTYAAMQDLEDAMLPWLDFSKIES